MQPFVDAILFLLEDVRTHAGPGARATRAQHLIDAIGAELAIPESAAPPAAEDEPSKE